MKKVFEKFKKLKKAQKIQIIIASLLTLALLIGLPVYAWFADTYRLETMTKIKEPTNLDLRAGHYHPIINFELSNINIEEMQTNGTPEYRVFSVSEGVYKIDYRIQLAHTTNIPFKYSIYKATEVDEEGENTVAYKPLYKDPGDPEEDGTTYYYEIGNELTLTVLNGDEATSYGRIVASKNNDYYDMTYDDADNPELYAVPLYLQSEKIRPSSTDVGAHDYYILKIEWDTETADTNFAKWNKAENNKETDIVYISASRSTD